MSSYEKRVAKILDELGFEYVFQKSMYKEGVTPKYAKQYKVDFYLPYIRLAIEVDGEQHFDPRRYPDRKRAAGMYMRRKQLDKRKELLAEKLNWKLLRIAYYELRDREAVKQKILEAIKDALDNGN